MNESAPTNSVAGGGVAGMTAGDLGVSPKAAAKYKNANAKNAPPAINKRKSFKEFITP